MTTVLCGNIPSTSPEYPKPTSLLLVRTPLWVLLLEELRLVVYQILDYINVVKKNIYGHCSINNVYGTVLIIGDDSPVLLVLQTGSFL